MKYKLINTPNEKYNAKQQILINRGMAEEDLVHYMNLTDDDINPPEAFGFNKHLNNDSKISIIIDCDCDGYTSSAIISNYIYDLKDDYYIEHFVSWFMHDGKQHGLSDAMDWLEIRKPDLIIIPDAGSNDVDQLRLLDNKGIDVIILDHHEIEERDFWNIESHPHLYLINSQLPQYPNKFLSGAGVVWQFCRYVNAARKLPSDIVN